MRKRERLMGSLAEVENALRSARIMRLAMSVDDTPYLVPLNFGYEAGALYFHCAAEGKKLDLIRKNPRVAFEVEVDVEVTKGNAPCSCTTYFRSVIGEGEAHILTDLIEKRHGLDVLMVHHGGEAGPYNEKAFELAVVVKIEIISMTGKKHGRP